MTGDAARAIEDDEGDALLRGLAAYRTVVLAVSGGADSLALAVLAARWGQRSGSGPPRPKIVMATVDHGLRIEAATEARFVADMAQRWGIAHHTLVWPGAKPSRGVQAAARQARYGLLAGLALQLEVEPGAACIVTAHHQDDLAETLLMRMARGSGLDGLVGMAGAGGGPGWTSVAVERPLLAVPKVRLEATLVARGVRWVDDPSNRDRIFERVRLRAAQPVLAELGLTNDRIALSARRLARSLDALAGETRRAFAREVAVSCGAMATVQVARLLEPGRSDVLIRLLQACLGAFGGRGWAADLSDGETAAERIRTAVAAGTPAAFTIAGCRLEVRPQAGDVRLWREAGRAGLPVVPLEPGKRVVWDGRYMVSLAPQTAGGQSLEVRALDPSVLEREAARRLAGGVPRRALATLPAVWCGRRLVALPPSLAGTDVGRPADDLQKAIDIRWLGPAGLASAIDHSQ